MRCRLEIAIACALVVCGCFESNMPGHDGGTGVRDGGQDGDRADGSWTDSDGGRCDRLGRTRLCGLYCGQPCPDGERFCHEPFAVCASTDGTGPRGVEQCVVSLEGGHEYCYTGALCVVDDEHMLDEDSWGGGCVSEEYCRWVREQPELDHLRCRYSEGLPLEDGPPDHECADGAPPENPFCGGACGDTCPPHVYELPIGCAGISETRGFGVCVPDMRRRCDAAGRLADDILESCALTLSVQGAADPTCACMLLSPVLMEEYADRGWVVSQQSCLAYRDRFPGEVRCFDDRGTEL